MESLGVKGEIIYFSQPDLLKVPGRTMIIRLRDTRHVNDLPITLNYLSPGFSFSLLRLQLVYSALDPDLLPKPSHQPLLSCVYYPQVVYYNSCDNFNLLNRSYRCIYR